MNKPGPMKHVLLILFVHFSAVLLAQGLIPEHPIMCSDVVAETEATCTGSSNCRACKNCKYCKHCNSGGSCGVCGGGRSSYRSSTRSTKSTPTVNRAYGSSSSRSSSSSIYNLPDDRYSEYYLKTLIVTNSYLNMRSGPGTGYRIIRRLQEDQLLTFLAMTGSWVKVRIKGGETIGFVHMKYVAVLVD